MKVLQMILILLSWIAATSIYADEQWTVEKVYKNFRYTYSLKQVFLTLQKDARWFADQCKKGEEQCDFALQEFNKPNSKYVAVNWPLDGYHPHYTVLNCKTNRIVAHPNKALHRIVNNPKVDLRSVKDMAGRLIGQFACDQVKNHPKGGWFYQITTWDKSITKLNDRFSNFCPIVRIEGTDFQLFLSIPFQVKDDEQLQEVLDDLNELTIEWSK